MVSYLDSLMTFLDSFPFFPVVSFIGTVALIATRKYRHTVYFLATMVLVGGIAVALKTGIDAPRPYVKQGIKIDETSFSFLSFDLYPYEDAYASFPSMHAMTAFGPVGVFVWVAHIRRLHLWQVFIGLRPSVNTQYRGESTPRLIRFGYQATRLGPVPHRP